MTTAVGNERTKLTANALDRASTACIAVGILAPLAALLQGQASPYLPVWLSFAGWLGTAIVLHFGARRILGGIKP